MLQFVRDVQEIKRLEDYLGRELTSGELNAEVEDKETHFIAVLPVVWSDGYIEYKEIDLFKYPFDLLADPNVLPIHEEFISFEIDESDDFLEYNDLFSNLK